MLDTVRLMSTDAILLVEDDDAIAAGLVRVLEGQGYTVRRLGRGTGAVSAADPSVGLVVLDLGLPDVDGLDVCRRLRAARPDLAILILTARDLELDIVAGWTRAPTTTSSNRSACPSCSPGSARIYAAAPPSRPGQPSR